MPSHERSDDPLQPVRDLTGGGTLATAVAGAILMTVTGFVPGSPLLGGALTGYLVRDDRGRGTRAGAFAGAIASVPTAIVALAVFWFSAIFAMGGFPFAVAGGLFALFVLLTLLYTVGLAALGGYLGVVAYERRGGRDRSKRGPASRDRHESGAHDGADSADRY